MNSSFDKQIENNIVIYSPSGHLPTSIIEDIQRVLKNTSAPCKGIVVNLNHLVSANSQDAGVIMKLHKISMTARVPILYCELHKRVLDLLDMLDLIKIIKVFQTQEQAVKRLQNI